MKADRLPARVRMGDSHRSPVFDMSRFANVGRHIALSFWVGFSLCSFARTAPCPLRPRLSPRLHTLLTVDGRNGRTSGFSAHWRCPEPSAETPDKPPRAGRHPRGPLSAALIPAQPRPPTVIVQTRAANTLYHPARRRTAPVTPSAARRPANAHAPPNTRSNGGSDNTNAWF